MQGTVSDEDRMEGVVRRVKELRGGVPHDEVELRVKATFARLADAPVRDFLPILVERQVLEQLRHRT